jgi:hypothetical protein
VQARPFSFATFLALLWFVVFAAPNIRAATVIPFKKSGSNLQVNFSGGTLQLVLEGNTGSGWKPLAVQYGGKGIQNRASRTTSKTGKGTAIFPIPAGYKLSQLRILSSPAKFPPSLLFKSPRDFPGTLPAVATATLPLYASGNVAMAPAVPEGDAEGSSEVTESDIWKVAGDRLFFFNQYRGLQVFDISDPANPVRTGSLRLAASGEQLFLLNDEASYLALLGHDAANNGVVYVISMTGGVPSLVTRLPLQGTMVDSRLIGSRLYIASSWYGGGQVSGGVTSAVIVQGFDLADPVNPVSYDPLPLVGHWPVLQGTSETLLVAASSESDWTRSQVHVLDITRNFGQPALVKTLVARGTVGDTFKLNVSGGIVSIVSHNWNWAEGWNQQRTWVETFPAAGAQTEAIAQLELEEARGETLHATRFDGDRLYVVTFWNIDPLFVVDLSDPAAPAVKGHVDVPGWSTYIEPFGDRLLAVGVEGNKVTVSLFDVSDPATPTLISRVPLGAGSSWSEANYDEKAVGFFPERGVLLVPYESWNEGGAQSATAVLQVTSSEIVYKSSINHEFTARRAAMAGDNILSISGQELIIQGAADLSSLSLLSQLSLAWQVDRVLPFGRTHLIQIEDGSNVAGYYGGFLPIMSPVTARKTMLRISPADAPDDLIEEVEMGSGRVIGAVQKNGRLYVGQFYPGDRGFSSVIRTWVFDVSAPPVLPDPTYVDTVLVTDGGRLNLDRASALWANESTLVWHLPTYAYLFGGPFLLMPGVIAHTQSVAPSVALPGGPISPAANASIAASNSLIVQPWFGQSTDVSAVLCPVSLAAPRAPVALPAIPIRGTPGAAVRSTEGKAFAAGGFVFSSYQEDSRTAVKGAFRSSSRHWLQVVDFRDPIGPVIRNRVSLPGDLASISEVDDRGAVLLTASTGGNVVRACAYDGVSAYQVDAWTDKDIADLLTADATGRLFLARSFDRPQITSVAFDLAAGKLRVAGTIPVAHPVYDMAALNGILLTSNWGRVNSLAITPGGNLRTLTSLETSGNLWLQVSRASLDPGNGIWLPAGAYGVEFLRLAR